MSRNFCNIWKEKKTLLCLELTLYMLYISISLSRSTVIDITSVTPSTLHYYAKQWQEASNKLFHIANENNSFSTLSNPSAEQSVATPRRHALADTHTFSSKKTDCGMSQTTHNVPFSRLVSQIRAHQLEAVRLLMHDSQFIQTNKELLSSVKAAKGSGSTYPCTFSTADVIRLSTSLTSFYLHRPFSTSLALLCATEAFSECYFLRYLNENCLTSQTTCSMMERKDPLEEIVFQDNLDTERFKYQHLMPVCPAHNMTDFDESFWSMPNVIHETSSIFEFKMNSLALTLVRPFDSLQTSQSRQIFHFAYLMINAAMNLFSSWLSIGDDNDACDVLVTTLVTLSHRLILPLPYYTLASHLLCLQIQKVCSKTFSRDIPFFLKNSLFQSTILYLLPALYRFWSKCLLALAEKKTKYLLTQHLIMPTCLLYTGPTLISNTYTLNSLDLLLHKLLQFYETLIKVFPILTTRSYNKNYLKEKKPLLVTYEHMFYSISFLYTKLLTLSETILTFPCFQKNTSLESTLMYFPKMDAITHDLSFVKSLETVFQCSIKIFSCLNDFPASTFFHCCMETLQSFDECTKTFLTTFLLYKEFNPLPQNSLLMTLFSLVSALTAYIVAQCVGSQYYSKLTAQVALKALRHLYHLFKMSFSLPDLLFLYYELHDLVILNLAKHTRFSSMYGYRCLQKKFIETTPTLNKVVMDTAEFLLTHSCDTVKKAAAQKTHTALEFSKPSQLNFPIEWTIIIIEIEKKKNFIRLHFWRYIPEPIRAHLVKYLVKHACHTKESNWLCSTSEWIPETNWISLQEKLQNIREDNYASAKQTVNVQSEIPYDELPLARRTRQGKKRCETDSIQRWWQKRFSIERELCRWLENFEKCLNTSFPLLQFVSGWPASFMQQSFLTLLDVAANACKIWCIQTNNNMLMEFSIFYHLVHFTLTFCNFNVECQLSCETLRVESSLKVGYEKYFKHCFEKRYLYTYQASSKKIWKSFLNGPVHLLTQYLLSFNSFKKISFSLQKYLPSHFKPSVYGISNHPIVLFLNSHDLFSHEIPWNALPTLRGHNITLGIDISVCQSLYSKWVTGTTPYLDPRTATKFLVINPSNDNSLPQKAVPHEWISSSSETSNLIFNNIFLNTVPQAQAILYNLCHKNIYIYCGHGGGSQFIHPQKIQSGYVSTQDSLQGKRGATITAMALLMGCSSIKFFRESSTQQSEVSSFAFNFHIGGAPSILGLLWDATDHDLDRFTLCCLSAWCNVWQLYQPDATCTSVTTFWGALSHSKRIARTSCYLKWLTGGACIQTGLPF
ncbi:uncharacterized protein LOC128883522 [Hylaeus volcanicus]|uniref:uncharacterized protein LOC128883522 n=1 Tax=Hylaeus volcanicus TaxID=313075 RepID=UPI0023B7FCDC|nr:uncharacterized protein LOC128883522 [Hylaeus volcanicus]